MGILHIQGGKVIQKVVGDNIKNGVLLPGRGQHDGQGNYLYVHTETKVGNMLGIDVTNVA